jgi:subtilisin-like proprotein convertase family protein
MTLDVTGSGGTALTLPVDVQIGRGINRTATGNSPDVPKAIPDNLPAGVTSDLALTGNGTVTDVTVTIGQLTHTFDGDLTIEIVSPTGKRVTLFNRRGSSGDNLTNTVFSDAAATAIGSGVAPFTGSFRPETPLAAMVGEPAAGTWKLAVVDGALQDTGTLGSWGASVSRRDFVCD